jgi:hypothetical protein
MAHEKSYERIPWVDRFNRPTVEQLRASLPSAEAHLFDDARRRLHALGTMREALVWHGENWRWTIAVHPEGAEHPLAVLIPSPSDLQLAILLDPEFMRTLPLRRMKRIIRDGLELGSAPFDTRWGVWSLSPAGLLDDLQDVIVRKFEQMMRPVAAAKA